MAMYALCVSTHATFEADTCEEARPLTVIDDVDSAAQPLCSAATGSVLEPPTGSVHICR